MSNDWFKTAPALQNAESVATIEAEAEDSSVTAVEEVPAEEAVVEETPAEVVAEEVAEEPVETPVTETAVAEEEVTTPTPVKLDLSKIVEEHEDSLVKYLEIKRTDFQGMAADKVIERKLREENPDWSDNDIKGELKDRYGIGLEKIEINEDEMTSDEIKEAKENNRLVERGERLLKSDAKTAKEYFEKIKSETKLPELELPSTQPSEEEYVAGLQRQLEQQRKAWVEQVNGASKSVSSIQRTIEVEDGDNGKVAFNIDYKLSDKQKQQVSEYLYDYMAHPKDVEKYVKADGSPDLVRFMADKAILNEEILNSMFRSVAKEAMAVARKSVIKQDLLNHDDGVRNRPVVTSEGNHMSDAQSKAWRRK